MLPARLLALFLVLVRSAAGQGQAPFENGGRPTVSPDGRLIAFTSERGGKPQIYLMKPDGSGVRQLTNETDRIGRPYWSPDGQRILYSIVKSDTATVYSIPVTGGPPTRLGRLDLPRHCRGSPGGRTDAGAGPAVPRGCSAARLLPRALMGIVGDGRL